MIASRMAIHKTTAEMVALRFPYEEMVGTLFDYFDINLIYFNILILD